ncbi:YidB family protein [soil metagenome]
MANKMPSIAALLGLIAVAAYQNRDRIGDFIGGLTGRTAAPGTDGGKIAGTPQDKSVLGGLGELVDHFRQNGLGEAADSWIGKGPNAPVDDTRLAKTLGPDLIDGLVKQTGLSREELLARLSKVLPEAVDKMTPDGRLPA